MSKVETFEHEALLDCGYGRMFGPGNAQLPVPNMLMMDRITRIADSGGAYDKGEIIAELDVRPDLWFFDCHFPGVGEVKFTGQVLPTASKVTYYLDMKRVITRKLVLGIADGRMEVDGREIYTAKDLRVGLFVSTEGF